MKIQVVPEDIILEYVKKRLQGNLNPVVKYRNYFDQLPSKIEVSEEFLDEWKKILQITVQKYIVSKFKLKQFIFEENDRVKRYSVADPQFWNNTKIEFSYRSVDRIWELIKIDKTEFLLTKPGDALFLSILAQNFSNYSLEWLIANKACWAIIAVFIQVYDLKDNSGEHIIRIMKKKGLPLPLRGLLLESAANTITKVNQEISAELKMEKPYFAKINRIAPSIRELINSINSAVKRWTGEESLALDDERYIRGLHSSLKLDQEFKIFEDNLNKAAEKNNLKEAIHESIIQS